MNRGLLSRSAAVIIPVTQVADRFRLNHGLRSFILSGVRCYQSYLSPYKGFSCAHRQVYGGVSCSEYFRQSVQNEGLAGALPHFQQRLRACKQASRILNASLPHSQKRRKKREILGDCGAGWCDSSCIPLDICDVCDLDCDLSPDCDALEGLDGCIDCGGCDCGW